MWTESYFKGGCNNIFIFQLPITRISPTQYKRITTTSDARIPRIILYRTQRTQHTQRTQPADENDLNKEEVNESQIPKTGQYGMVSGSL